MSWKSFIVSKLLYLASHLQNCLVLMYRKTYPIVKGMSITITFNKRRRILMRFDKKVQLLWNANISWLKHITLDIGKLVRLSVISMDNNFRHATFIIFSWWSWQDEMFFKSAGCCEWILFHTWEKHSQYSLSAELLLRFHMLFLEFR